MSQKKIIFLIVSICIIILIAGSMFYISKRQKNASQGPKTLTIWINEGASEDYKEIIDGFKAYAPEYKKTDIVISKQTNDPERYRTLLLSTISEGKGPDIFMIQSNEDALLESKISPIPNNILDFSDFERNYDDIFTGLLESSGSTGGTKTIKGIPLGYETLGVYYNKALIRQVPSTWNELELLYNNFPSGKYPSNLGLGPIYTPNAIDILPIWFGQSESDSYINLSDAKEGIQTYMSYRDIRVARADTENTNTSENTPSEATDTPSPVDQSNPSTLGAIRDTLLMKKISTLDLFMQGDIGMIIGYPSLITELEKSSKRVGSETVAKTILTAKIPQFSLKKTTNTGRYRYLAISKLSENGIASAKFLEYLMQKNTQPLLIKAYPYLIPPQTEFQSSVISSQISETLPRVTLKPFIPELGETLSVYNYGIKSRFERGFKDVFDRNTEVDIDELTRHITQEITCEISSSQSENNNTSGCQNQ